ncbi:hypothetical protein [Stenotrophomonas acidaminiphila]|uniref:hypothetical protein n=1 Tax=Stenotrophomonas acidaminiphila TaxID=128780 RepID=UPI001FAF09AC|nr:hypothetical protein [Stenotrophomonas acidaminiphila]
MPVIVSKAQAPRVVVVSRRATAGVAVKDTAAVIVDRPAPVAAVRADTRAVAVVGKGAQGPEGPVGPPGPAGGDVFVRQADGALGGHRVVRSTGQGAAGYADAQVAEHGDDVLGITLGAAVAGDEVQIQGSGEIVEPSWAWQPQEPIFLGAHGAMTQVPPAVDSAAFLLVLGFATSATSMQVRIETPIYFED